MEGSRAVVYAAMAANIAIAALKFAMGLLMGSSAMISEGLHSTVDAGNDVLLLAGMRLSRRAATTEHPFGHGKEAFFWGLIVAVLIFGPDEVLLTLDVEFGDDQTTDDIVDATREIQASIRKRYPKIRRIYVQAGGPAGSEVARPRGGGISRDAAVISGRWTPAPLTHSIPLL